MVVVVVEGDVVVGETGIGVSGALCDWHVAQVWWNEEDGEGEVLVDRYSLGMNAGSAHKDRCTGDVEGVVCRFGVLAGTGRWGEAGFAGVGTGFARLLKR